MDAINQNLVKALGHPLRVRILEALQGRSASPVQLSKEFKQSLGVVSYHTNSLLECGCIEQTRTRPRRGTIEHFFTAVPRSFIGSQDWRRVPFSARTGVSDAAIATFIERIGRALDGGTIDEREDTTLNWMPMQVDEQGWVEMAKVLDATRADLLEVQTRSRQRLDGEDGIPVITGLAAFEVPPTEAEADHPTV